MRKFANAGLAAALLAVSGAVFCTGAAAQGAADYPSRTVTVVSPFVAGGMSSLLARAVGQRLEQRLGKNFIIENRPGGATITGALSVAHAAPDGYTLLIASSSTLAINVTLYKSLPYDPVMDFVPLALVARTPEVLVVNQALPVHSLDDLKELAKRTSLTFGSAGLGTGQHINGELLKLQLGISMTHIPYRGIAPALNDAAGGHISLMFTDIPIATPLIIAGKLRPIGVTSPERVAALPDVPPLSEIGLPGFHEEAWFMFLAPAKTPRDIVEKLAGAMREALREPVLRADLTRLGAVPATSPPVDELKVFLHDEIARSGEMVRSIGLAGAEQSN
jgi:tripartite-type tricarboxylate transporter receptor subunit TctC